MGVWNNGFLHLVINLGLLALALYLCIDAGENNFTLGGIIGGICWILWGLHVSGFKMMVIQPNHARVLTFFGKYVGTVRDNGFFWTNPFYVRKKMSLRADNMDVEPIKVNDRNGNPIMIGLVLVWKVEDTYRACFDVEATSYNSFVAVQSDSALRKVASLYAYDNLEDQNEVTLRNGGDEINRRLEQEIRKHLEIAGIEVVEARINYRA
ncbi:MAG: SPFH domain-containing protein, partial [Bacteroidales bacterium]|nr:SPFH domain-containing protein [Bacteroidales bacterium]